MARDRETGSQSLIEVDIGSFAEEAFLPWNDGQAARTNMITAFKHFVQSSGLTTELSALEEKDYMHRFIGECTQLLKGLQREDMKSVWSRALKKALDDEMPGVTDYSVERINSQKLGYTAMKNDIFVSRREFKNQLSLRLPTDIERELAPVGKTSLARSSSSVPESFDPRSNWPHCADVFVKSHDERYWEAYGVAPCASAWAFSAASTLDSRICIATNGSNKVVLSRQYLMTCTDGGFGCRGGWPSNVFKHFWRVGSPTERCSRYQGYDGNGCPQTCEGSYPRSMQNDMYRDATRERTTTYQWSRHGEDGHAAAQLAIYQDGPVAGVVYAGERWKSYRSGLFEGDCSHEEAEFTDSYNAANHAIVVIGWSSEVDSLYGNFYYSTVNSWGPLWGENGTMRVSKCTLQYFILPGPVDAPAEGWPMPIG